MVQALAQELISLAKRNGAQDIYFVPKNQIYELHMRIGDERCLVATNSKSLSRTIKSAS